MSKYRGLHHISVIAGDPQENYDFYVKKLGMRMVKKTVNQDDPTKYHLFYANSEGSPGSSLTFFPWPRARQGDSGSGEATAVSLAVPESSLDYWQERLDEQNIPYSGPLIRFGKKYLSFKDPDGLQLHLVFDGQKIDLKSWNKSPVPDKYQIQGFWSTTLRLHEMDHTEQVLTSILGFKKVASEENATLYKTESELGHSVIIEEVPFSQGQSGAGIVHHVAFQTEDAEDLKELRHEVLRFGLQPTEIIDRHFFKSVYYRTPGGVLFEMATHGPGYFVNSDPSEDQAQKLELTPWHETRRTEIEAALPTIEV
ncbi:glyoxalase family protein [Fodinibius salinus]|uniref:Glyoxalase family protein n=1 Tax=Fodinibius salinus TaxID=860790 RepID=A0A5D3YI14_9BACT|nr:ring-cleaving dioxygenase [Fodinibius salinus]TYP93413.1 glyoxalase family protein [Fodinibius salinus]